MTALGCVQPRDTPDASSAPDTWRLVLNDLEGPLLSAWEAPTGELYAVGGREGAPLVLRHDSRGWWRMDPGTPHALWWVFGFSSTHVYAVGERGVVTYFGGQSWQVVRDGDDEALWGVWGESPSALWSVGGDLSSGAAEGVVLRSMVGGRFVRVGSVPGLIFKVWGRSTNDVTVVGDRGFIAHLRDGGFESEASGTTERLVTITGADGARFVVGGLNEGVVLSDAAGTWNALTPPAPVPGLSGVATKADQLIISGQRGYLAERSGAKWTQETPLTDATLHAVVATSSGFVAVGGHLDQPDGRGVLLASHPLEAGSLQPWPFAGRARFDAGVDAGAVSIVDAGIARLELGAFCDRGAGVCSSGTNCWYVAAAERSVCTISCRTVNDCAAFGPRACCELPGSQTTTFTCLPPGVAGCDGGA